jgi:hypothetical protein
MTLDSLPCGSLFVIPATDDPCRNKFAKPGDRFTKTASTDKARGLICVVNRRDGVAEWHPKQEEVEAEDAKR